MSRILLVGGYGGFGAAIAEGLLADGHEVLVAGRSLDRARAFCAARAGLVPMRLDRADIAAALDQSAPDLVVDASGPFQAMDYAVPRACIAAGIPYCDIADSTQFVCAIGALDAAAKAAGVAIIAGTSSVPALSGAVIGELAKHMDEVSAVEMAISSSNQASAGAAVTQAILSQVGQRFSLRNGSRARDAYGWQEGQMLDFSVTGIPPLRHRLAYLVDVPDVQLMPDRLAGKPAVTFRAGTELGIQNRVLWGLSWLVRWGLVPNLLALAGWIMPLRRLTSRLGSARSAMMVRLFGLSDGQRVERRWTLIAERGDGPRIPALSVPPLVRRILAGGVAPGARDAGAELALADYEPAFAKLAVHHAVSEHIQPAPLYRRVMGERFDQLPPEVRAMHSVLREGVATGDAEVTGAANLLGRLVAAIMRFPPPGRHQLDVWFAERDGIECWHRHFGDHTFASTLSQPGPSLVERFGPIRFRFALDIERDGLRMRMQAWSIWHIALPLVLAPRSEAREWAQDGWFHFDVPIALPLIGRIVHYRGRLQP